MGTIDIHEVLAVTWILVIACILATAEAGKTKCQQLQQTPKPGMVGAFVPQCKDNGEFEETQCWQSTGYCWCVDKDGNEIAGTKIRGDPGCSKAGKTKCQKLQLVPKPGMVGAFVPQCKANGEFEEKQCWLSTGYCWCVDKDGKEIAGTKIRGDPGCGKTKCQKLQLPTKPGMVGAFVPKCKDNGEFEEKQCWLSTGYCWCVDKDGNEIPGTKIRGDPSCSR